ncbi:hypothetical protein KIPB_006769 [Kipferlia bialata]|uniref:Uncharacterized protein n=1 Tax=Kipferlia bialata TaxID=797122 RepID=A0A9K3CXR6_9EUKA|nr:hypothetical protein KIPB_006769 [Kipferlia bialata]|eukprot:g6769.t1
MKTVVIVYSSVTGNTKHVAEVIAETLAREDGTDDTFSGDAITTVLVNADTEYKRQHTNPEYTGYTAGDAYVVGCTTAAFRTSDLMREYLAGYPRDMMEGKPCAVYGMCAGTAGYVRRELANLLRGNGAVICAHDVFKGPTNYLAGGYPKAGKLQVWPEADHTPIQAFAEGLTSAFDRAVADPQMKCKVPLGGVSGAIFRMVPGKKIDGMMRMSLGPLSVDNTRCLRCAKCVVSCPYGALAMVEAEGAVPFDPTYVEPGTGYYPDRQENTEYVQSRIAAGVNSTRVVVQDEALCHGCYRCIHVCPTAAINPTKRMDKWKHMPRYHYTEGTVQSGKARMVTETEYDALVTGEQEM